MKKINQKFIKKFTKSDLIPILSHITKQWSIIRAWDFSTCIGYHTSDYDHLDDWVYLNIDLWIKSELHDVKELLEFDAFKAVNNPAYNPEDDWYEFLLSVASNELFEFYNLMRLLKRIIAKKTFAVSLQWIHFWKERIAWSDWFMLFYTENFYEKSDKEFLFDVNSIHAILAHEYHWKWIKFYKRNTHIIIISDDSEMVTTWSSIELHYPEYFNDKIIPSEFVWEYKADFDEVLQIAKYMKLDYIKVKDQILEAWYGYISKLKNSIWDIHMSVKSAKIINWMTIKQSTESHFSNIVQFPISEINEWTLVIKKIKNDK